jgi:Flp pilus assembly protein TadG
MRLRSAQRRVPRGGVATVELAVLLPMLCFLFVIAIDYARIFYYSLTLENAARNGAYYASNYPGIYAYTNAQAVVTADVSNLSPAPTVEIRYSTSSEGPFETITPINNGYVQVQVTWTFKSITKFPGVPTNTILTRRCRMKVAPITPTFS